ncbi:hypothetical protein ACQRIT_006037 [Beauveria bassiana]
MLQLSVGVWCAASRPRKPAQARRREHDVAVYPKRQRHEPNKPKHPAAPRRPSESSMHFDRLRYSPAHVHAERPSTELVMGALQGP